MQLLWLLCSVLALATLQAATGRDVHRGSNYLPVRYAHGRSGLSHFLVQKERTARGKFNVRRITDRAHQPVLAKKDNDTCSLCPSPQLLSPCKCSCEDGQQPEITCGPELSSCTELTLILNKDIFPSTNYNKLKVYRTQLDCKLESDLWGPLSFQRIILVDNEFSILDNHAFQTFNNTLKILHLRGNKLSSVFFADIHELPFLEALNIEENEIEFIPGNQAMNNSALRAFKAGYNKVAFLSRNTFAGFPRLKVLDLSHNKITQLSQHSLRIPDHKAYFLEIDLSFNDISKIDSDAVSGIKNCSINLRNNKLLTLPEHTYRPLIDFANALITVTENPLDCDCSICWIVNNSTVSRCFDNFRCPNLNEALSSVSEDDLGNCTRGNDLLDRGVLPLKTKLS